MLSVCLGLGKKEIVQLVMGKQSLTKELSNLCNLLG